MLSKTKERLEALFFCKFFIERELGTLWHHPRRQLRGKIRGPYSRIAPKQKRASARAKNKKGATTIYC
jgi:hypothetical protein